MPPAPRASGITRHSERSDLSQASCLKIAQRFTRCRHGGTGVLLPSLCIAGVVSSRRVERTCDAVVVDSDVTANEAAAQLDRLAEVLLNRCAWVYGRLATGARLGVTLQEETLTEDLLLDIANHFPPESGLELSQYTRRQESRSGADWQWWFHERRWFGVRVQAKKLRRPRSGGEPEYDLAYMIRKKHVSPRRQLDVLLKQASKDHIAPVYVFYNGPELDVGRMTWECGQLPRSRENFGVSYLHAAVVDLILRRGKADLDTVTASSRPWPCLIRCEPGWGCHRSFAIPPGPAPFEEAVASSLFRTVVESPVSNAAQDNPSRYLRERIENYCHDDPPEYVRDLAAGRTVDESLLRSSVHAVTLFSHKPRS